MLHTLLQASTPTIREHRRPSDTDRTRELLEKYGLNFEVDTVQLFDQNGGATPFYATRRRDTGALFETVKSSYSPMQNSLLAEYAFKLAEELGTDDISGYSFQGGSTATIMLRSLPLELPKIGDTVNSHICLVNSHNKLKPFGVSFKHETLSCLNGMSRMDRHGYIAIKHTSGATDRMDEIMRGAEKIAQQSEDMFGDYSRFLEKKIEKKHVEDIMQIVTGVTGGFDAVRGRMRSILDTLSDSIASEMSYKGENFFGLLNGVTHYTTRLSEGSESAMKEKYFGKTAKKDLLAYQYLKENL